MRARPHLLEDSLVTARDATEVLMASSALASFRSHLRI